MKAKIILSSTIKVRYSWYVIYSEFGEHYKKKTQTNVKYMQSIDLNVYIWW